MESCVKSTEKHSRTVGDQKSKSVLEKSENGSNSPTNSTTSTSAGPSHPMNTPFSHFPSQILDKYEIGDILGDGNFSVVRVCTERKSKQRYALKVIDKSMYKGRDVPNDQEIKILSKVHHPNVVALYEHYDSEYTLYVVMELMEAGDLFDAIKSVFKFSEKESKVITNDIASALAYLHSHRIVHRDIRPENLLVYFQAEAQLRVKVADFGLAKIFPCAMHSVCGALAYSAPEMLLGTGYGEKVDVWALGVIVYIMLCGYQPFFSLTENREEISNKIVAGDFEFYSQYWGNISQNAKDFISKMLARKADSRMTAKEALEHPWVAVKNDHQEKRRRSQRIALAKQMSTQKKPSK